VFVQRLCLIVGLLRCLLLLLCGLQLLADVSL
jgi:hypothetical protein